MMRELRLACSNLAWVVADEAMALACLERNGVRALEIAPTRLWPDWEGATPQAARAAAADYRSRGFEIVSMQALLFGMPRALLFGPDGATAFERHLVRVAKLGQALGARVAVLGAPQHRRRGDLPVTQAWCLAEPVLRRLACVYEDAGMCLAVEPVRPEYGGDFLTTTEEVIEAVRCVNHPGLRVHLDAAALHSAAEDLPVLWARHDPALFAHFQISEPGLSSFKRPVAPHVRNLRHLLHAGYDGWCSIEMLPTPAGLQSDGPWALLHETYCPTR